MDMPLFVIAVIYGLMGKHATWQGAIAGYLSGAVVGTVFTFGYHWGMAPVTFLSGGVAALVCPIISLLTAGQDQSQKLQAISRAKLSGDEEQAPGTAYNIVPSSTGGRISVVIFGAGLVIFFVGVSMGAEALRHASLIAVAGMGTYFAGAILRTRFD